MNYEIVLLAALMIGVAINTLALWLRAMKLDSRIDDLTKILENNGLLPNDLKVGTGLTHTDPEE